MEAYQEEINLLIEENENNFNKIVEYEKIIEEQNLIVDENAKEYESIQQQLENLRRDSLSKDTMVKRKNEKLKLYILSSLNG